MLHPLAKLLDTMANNGFLDVVLKLIEGAAQLGPTGETILEKVMTESAHVEIVRAASVKRLSQKEEQLSLKEATINRLREEHRMLTHVHAKSKGKGNDKGKKGNYGYKGATVI